MKNFTFKITIFLASFVIFLSGIKCVAQELNTLDGSSSESDESVYIKQMLTSLEHEFPDNHSFTVPLLLNGNISNIFQLGDNNYAFVLQKGVENFSGVVQVGDQNEVQLETVGNRNITVIEQYGLDNKAEKTIIGDEIDFYLQQRGNANTFSIEGNLPPGIRITQEGSGMSIIFK